MAERRVRMMFLGRREAALRLVRLAVALGLAVAGLTVVWQWSESSSTCRSCHSSSRPVGGAHEGTDCASCHRPAGTLGAARQAVALGGMIVRGYLLGEKPPTAAEARELDQSACLRCHRSLLLSEADRSGGSVRLRHGHLWRLRVPCGRCHADFGHSEEAADARSPMSECVRCHERQRVSTACKVCHIGKPSDVSSEERVVNKTGTFVVRTCRGCHEPKTDAECFACHGGYEMPHPAGWFEEHLYDGFVDQPDCFNCHQAPSGVLPAPHGAPTGGYGGAFCNECHTYPSPHGDGTDWIRLHGPASRGRHVRQEACLPCHSDVAVSSCKECHSAETCDRCHALRDARAAAGGGRGGRSPRRSAE